MGSLARLLVLTGVLGSLMACLGELPEVEDPCATWPEPGLYVLPVPGYDRRPEIYVPASPGPRDAVVVLHGAGSTGDVMRRDTTEFQEFAEREGHVALFPNGSGTPVGYYWNAGTCCGVGGVIEAPDVAFLDAAAAELRERVCVDRVVGTGFSNGAMMALRWSCEGTQSDGVLAAAGPLMVEGCGGAPEPVIYVHGEADPVVPIAGGDAALGVVFPDARDAFDAILARNQCTGEPLVTKVGDTTCSAWTCAAETRFCTIRDWRHRWPGARSGPEGFSAEDVVLDGLL